MAIQKLEDKEFTENIMCNCAYNLYENQSKIGYIGRPVQSIGYRIYVCRGMV